MLHHALQPSPASSFHRPLREPVAARLVLVLVARRRALKQSSTPQAHVGTLIRNRFVPISEGECDKASKDLAGEQGVCTRQLSAQLQALPHHFHPSRPPSPRPLQLDSIQLWVGACSPSITLSSPHPNHQHSHLSTDTCFTATT
jgi:hypothetical protein